LQILGQILYGNTLYVYLNCELYAPSVLVLNFLKNMDVAVVDPFSTASHNELSDAVCYTEKLLVGVAPLLSIYDESYPNLDKFENDGECSTE
jgi:hypothetical protein